MSNQMELYNDYYSIYIIFNNFDKWNLQTYRSYECDHVIKLMNLNSKRNR